MFLFIGSILDDSHTFSVSPAHTQARHTITDNEFHLKYILGDIVYNSGMKAATIFRPGYDSQKNPMTCVTASRGR
jgi:hypothetical protein